ncbi:MAG: DUF4143 domain-containing protein [Coriobacteriales bacterium]|jgi:predicted AAA+ superfamily ATPase|nr:DUF4143 domain-containing protein [Coriobacteriales bacterium]
MTLTREGYLPRIADQELRSLLETYGALSIEGLRWCGKTWLALNHANSVSYLMDANTRILAEHDTANVLTGETPHVIDEWQELPGIWDAVRFAVDQDPARGRYLLTGSVVKPSAEIRHSGIGRIAPIRLRTMSLYESGDSSGAISLKALLEGKQIESSKSMVSIQDIVRIACCGGWPVNVSSTPEDPYRLPFDYLNSVIENDVPQKEIPVRDTSKFRHFLASLARSNATIVKNTTIHDDVRSIEGEFSTNTLASYLQTLRDLFILEEIPGWNPQSRSKARILSSPKRLFADPSLAVAALGTTYHKLLDDLPAFGNIFEGLCIRDLLIYAQANNARVFHYRDNSKLEVDAIVEARDGSWAAFEIKLGAKGLASGAASLIRLKEKMLSAGTPKPSALIVLTGSQISQRREDGVVVVPITLLKP